MKKVRIIYKEETRPDGNGGYVQYQRPDDITTEANFPNKEQLLGKLIKKTIWSDEKGIFPPEKVTQKIYKPKFSYSDVTPEIKERIIKEYNEDNSHKGFMDLNDELISLLKSQSAIPDEVLIKEFKRRGKTDLSIAKYLDLDINDVKVFTASEVPKLQNQGN